MNILFYSSSPVISNMISNVLSDDNLTISTNPNGFVNNDYHLIMIDDGLFSESVFTHSIPVLLITTPQKEVLCQIVVSNHGGYIYKPFTPDELINVINKLTGE